MSSGFREGLIFCCNIKAEEYMFASGHCIKCHVPSHRTLLIVIDCIRVSLIDLC